MSWSPLLPAPSRAKAFAPVTASTSKGAGKRSPVLSITIRPAQLPGADWLAAGADVAVMVGHGEHAGMLRVQPRGPHRVVPVALSKPKGSMVALRLPTPPGLDPAQRPGTPLEFDYGDDWIEVELPAAWLPAAVRATRSAAAAVLPKPAPVEPMAPAPAPAAPTTPERGRKLAEQAAAMARQRAGL